VIRSRKTISGSRSFISKDIYVPPDANWRVKSIATYLREREDVLRREARTFPNDLTALRMIEARLEEVQKFFVWSLSNLSDMELLK